MSRGRICLYSPYLYPVVSGGRVPFAGGAEVQMTHLMRGMVERGLEVSVVTCDFGQPDDLVVDGMRLIRCFKPHEGLPGVRFFHPRLTSTIGGLVRANADLYMIQGAGLGAGIVHDFARARGRKFIFYSAHDHDAMKSLPDLPNPRDRWWYTRALRGADRVIAQTQKQREMFQREFGVESVVVTNPVRMPADAVDPGEHDTVVWLATYKASKRPEWFVRLARENPDLRCVMVGVVPMPPLTDEEYRAAREAAAGLPNLEVHGALPHERIGELFRTAGLFAHTSPAEGFPNTFLEAWSYGLPTATCFDPDGVIERERLGASRETYEAFAREVRRFMADPALRREVGARARAYTATHHGSGAIYDQFAGVVDELLARAGSAAG